MTVASRVAIMNYSWEMEKKMALEMEKQYFHVAKRTGFLNLKTRSWQHFKIFTQYTI
jgi:hypothetical protein